MEKTFCALVVVGGFMLGSACGRQVVTSDEIEVSGLLCFESLPDGMINIDASWDCAFGGCTTIRDSQCSGERSTDSVTVTVSLQTETRIKRFRPSCTADCLSPSVSCGSLALEPGEYSLVYGAPSRRFNGVLIVEEDAFASACVRGSDDGVRVNLPAGVECVGRPLDPARGCFGEPEDVGTRRVVSFDGDTFSSDEPNFFEDPSGTCYRFEEFCRPEAWGFVPCSPSDSSARICD